MSLIVHIFFLYGVLTYRFKIIIFDFGEEVRQVYIAPTEKLFYPSGSALSDRGDEEATGGKPERPERGTPGEAESGSGIPPAAEEKAALEESGGGSRDSGRRLALISGLDSGFSLSLPPTDLLAPPAGFDFGLALGHKGGSGSGMSSDAAAGPLDLSKSAKPDYSGSYSGSSSFSRRSRRDQGGGSGRAGVSATVKRYDLGPWARQVVALIQRNWTVTGLPEDTPDAQVGISLVIQRSGELLSLIVEKASEVPSLDQAAVKAVKLSLPLPPIPEDFPENDLVVYLVFEYGLQ